MNKKEKEEIYYNINETEVTPEDGFVDKRKIFPNTLNDEHGYFYGYGKNVSLETNDPRLALPFMYAICSIFFVVGITILFFSILFKTYPIGFFGLMFIAVSLYAVYVSIKNVKNIASKTNIKVNYGLVHNLTLGYRMLGQIIKWPIKTVFENLFKK